MTEHWDNVLAQNIPEGCRRQDGLLILALHTVYADRQELAEETMHPQQRLLLSDLRLAVEQLLADGYRFVGARGIAQGLSPAGRYCLLSFDDGYQNNLAVLPLLREYGIQALFSVVPQNIETGESFWWDAVYRAGKKTGKNATEIDAFIQKAKLLPPRTIRAHLLGSGLTPPDFLPRGDLDRPLTRAELVDLSRAPEAFIGNHTWAHEILTQCRADEMKESLERAQCYFKEVTGTAPEWIAYPNGDHDRQVQDGATSAGLKWGVTLQEKINPIHTRAGTQLALGRYLLWGDQDIPLQCRRMQLAFSFTRWARSIKRGLTNRAGRQTRN